MTAKLPTVHHIALFRVIYACAASRNVSILQSRATMARHDVHMQRVSVRVSVTTSISLFSMRMGVANARRHR